MTATCAAMPVEERTRLSRVGIRRFMSKDDRSGEGQNIELALYDRSLICQQRRFVFEGDGNPLSFEGDFPVEVEGDAKSWR